MTSTRSTRLLTTRKLPKLLRCQDFPPGAINGCEQVRKAYIRTNLFDHLVGLDEQ
jgi:hypothetical protein